MNLEKIYKLNVLLICMSLISQVKGRISRIEETLDLAEASKRAREASDFLETVRRQISAKKYEKLNLSLGLAEFRAENNCYSGCYH